jgi:hypothetical protein
MTPSPALSPSQFLRVSALALLLWITGAVMIRVLIPFEVFAGGVLTVLIFAVGIAINLPTIWLIQRLGGLRREQTVYGMALGSAVAIICDGVAITWVPWLYGGITPDLHRAGAWLLWTSGFGLLGAFIAERRA